LKKNPLQHEEDKAADRQNQREEAAEAAIEERLLKDFKEIFDEKSDQKEVDLCWGKSLNKVMRYILEVSP